jgi:glycosyltransferase involved in cell wall biosynthesis
MRIHFLCSSGSPIGLTPPDIYSRGVGGAELSLMSLAEKLAQRGHEVVIYNDPKKPGDYDGVRYLPLKQYNHADERDAFVLFRTPHHTVTGARGKRIFWSCDQLTVGNFKKDIFPHVDKIVCISERHAHYFKDNYQLQRDDPRLYITNLGVRAQDYGDVEKVPGRMIYCSVPGRGLMQLANMWPKIKESVPHATLVVTADYRLWGTAPGDHEFRLKMMGMDGVMYLGSIGRLDLCTQQQMAEVQAYPCTYDELFCISSAECQYAGAISVTSNLGALPWTNQLGVRVDGMPGRGDFDNAFVEAIAKLYKQPELADTIRRTCQLHAASEFSWDTIALLWESEVLS